MKKLLIFFFLIFGMYRDDLTLIFNLLANTLLKLILLTVFGFGLAYLMMTLIDLFV
jgi:hypothetical protein